MTTLNFSGRFAGLVEARTKLQSIRVDRLNRLRVGMRLQLYTGLRTKNARKLSAVDPVIVENFYVAIRPAYLTVGGTAGKPYADAFAVLDGFHDYNDMVAWFQGTYNSETFIGRCIRWSFDEALAA